MHILRKHESQDMYRLVGRILLSLLFIFQGWEKLINFEGAELFFTSHGFPFPIAVTVIAIIVELIGGLALMFGFHTRVAATCIAAFTLILTFGVYRDFADYTQLTQILKNIAIVGGLMYVVASCYKNRKGIHERHESGHVIDRSFKRSIIDGGDTPT